MQTNEQPSDMELTSGHHHGHRRLPTVGKAMPVTSLFLDFPPPTMSTLRSSHMRDGEAAEQDRPPLYFPVDESNALKNSVSNSSSIELLSYDSEEEHQQEPAYELLVSECSSEAESDKRDGRERGPEEQISLVGNSIFYTPCLTCTGTAAEELIQRPSAINEMCRRLCTDECRLRLSLAGFEPPSEAVLKSREALVQYVKESVLQRPPLQHTYSEDTLKAYSLDSKVPKDEEEMVSTDVTEAQPRPPTRIAIQRKQFLTDLLGPQLDEDTDSDDEQEHGTERLKPAALLEIVSSIVTPRAEEPTGRLVDAHELAMLKDFREKYAIAEALAKTSAMTSTAQMRQRLAARKLEIERENGGAHAHDMCALEGSGTEEEALRKGAAAGARKGSLAEQGASPEPTWRQQQPLDSNLPDTVATAAQQQQEKQAQEVPQLQNGNDFEPPRNLLLYLVRMGSFNSAPKIQNHDSQDDGLEVPKGLNTIELIQHVRSLRGEHHPPLLSRFFLKPTLTAQVVANDITDGLRSLKLNSVSRACSAPVTSPHHVRLLQWNILSQSLGQNNDGFVCCPEEALTWESRKFLIVQEILQHHPDVICLQEVDHFKFLQNILGSQNYEGIFFPKPDSPCLYIEENNGPDGCAIFFKRDKYELKNFETRVLEVWRVQSNQVAIAAHLQVRATGKEFCVCTTHLKARHGSLLSKLRNEQGRDLMRFVKRFGGHRPALLCGDFNAVPTEPVYTTMLSCDIMKLSSAYATLKAEHATNKSNDVESDVECSEAMEKVQKSIQSEPAYTTWKIREDGEECHTIDYVFYSHEHFKIKNCLEFPHGDEIGKDRTPSLQYPSDHFSLVCDFEILEVAQKPKSQ